MIIPTSGLPKLRAIPYWSGSPLNSLLGFPCLLRIGSGMAMVPRMQGTVHPGGLQVWSDVCCSVRFLMMWQPWGITNDVTVVPEKCNFGIDFALFLGRFGGAPPLQTLILSTKGAWPAPGTIFEHFWSILGALLELFYADFGTCGAIFSKHFSGTLFWRLFGGIWVAKWPEITGLGDCWCA